MFGLLLKKQLTEFFKNCFYNRKTGKKKSAAGAVFSVLLFFFLMAGLVGGSLGAAALPMCAALVPPGYGWLYCALFASLALFFGVLCSVPGTYASLYLARDNDLLLAMPIPPGTLLASRLCGVYLLGLFYSAVVMLPAVLVRQVLFGFDAASLFGGLFLLFLISLAVLFLTCALGYAVAKCSGKLKNKSFATVALSLLFLALYYFGYFKVQIYIRTLIANVETYGARLRARAAALWFVGMIGEGDFLYGLALFAALALALVCVFALMRRSFTRLAASGGEIKKIKSGAVRFVRRTPQAALLRKEFARFAASANYMLNCGLGVVMLIAAGVALLLYGGTLLEALDGVFSRGGSAVLLCGVVCGVLSTVEPATPSVSLEGDRLWILRSMPLTPLQILTAKLKLQLCLSVPAALFCALCALIALRATPAVGILILLQILVFSVLAAQVDLFFGLKMPVLHFTNEIVPIKQGLGVLFALLFGFAYAALYIGGWFWLGALTGAVPYLAAALALTLVLTLLCALWLKKRGAKIFTELS